MMQLIYLDQGDGDFVCEKGRGGGSRGRRIKLSVTYSPICSLARSSRAQILHREDFLILLTESFAALDVTGR
jgi:hypothetical protein